MEFINKNTHSYGKGKIPELLKQISTFLISNFCCVLNVVCFLLGNSPASEFYMLMFRNILSVPSSYAYEDRTD